MRRLWLVLLVLGGAAGALDPLAGDTRLGPGAWTTRPAVEAPGVVLWRDGVFTLTAPGPALCLAEPGLLAPGRCYTLAWAARGEQAGATLTVTLGKQRQTFPLTTEWRAAQYTFRAGEPSLAATGKGTVLLRYLRLVEGDQALAPTADTPQVAVSWGDEVGAPLWHGPTMALRIAAAASSPPVVQWCLADHAGVTLRAGDLEPRPEGVWRVPLSDLAPGLYRVSVSARADGRATTVEREVPVLTDLTGRKLAARLAIDRDAAGLAAEAARYGYRRVRLQTGWADAARTRLPLAALAKAGFGVDLALRLLGTVPPEHETARKLGGRALPDIDAFATHVRTLARQQRGLVQAYELEPEPWRVWPAADFVGYRRRLARALGAVGVEASVLGPTVTLDRATGRVSALLEEALARTDADFPPRATLVLPEPLSDAPEALLGPLVDELRALPVACGLDAPAPRDVPGELLAARLLRAWLLALRLAPDPFACGWRGGCGPREAALNNWLTRYDGARFVADLAVGHELRGVLAALPDGRGLAALWDAGDERDSLRAVDELGEHPALDLEPDVGEPVRASDLYGRDLARAGDGRLRVPLSFEPVYLEASSPAACQAALGRARVDGARGVRLAVDCVARAGRPGLLLRWANAQDAPQTGTALVLASDSAQPVARRVQSRLGARATTASFVPLRTWPTEMPSRLRVLADVGRDVLDETLTVLSWPRWRPRPAERVDADDRDWAGCTPLRVGTPEQLAPVSSADWLGPEDASFTVRGDLRDGRLAMFLQVTDDKLTPADHLEIAILGTEPFFDGQDLTATTLTREKGLRPQYLRFRPWVEGRPVLGRELVVPESVVPVLDVKDCQASLRVEPAGGWSLEFAVPLNVAASGGLGLEVTMVDDDGDGRAPTRLLAYGVPGAGARLASVFLPDAPLAELPVAAEPPLPLRTDLDPADGRVRLPLGGLGVSAPLVDFPREGIGLRAGPAGEVAGLATVAAPAGATRVWLWARGRGGTGEVGVRLGAVERWGAVPARWRRLSCDVPVGTPRVDLLTRGAVGVELAEVGFETP